MLSDTLIFTNSMKIAKVLLYRCLFLLYFWCLLLAFPSIQCQTDYAYRFFVRGNKKNHEVNCDGAIRSFDEYAMELVKVFFFHSFYITQMSIWTRKFLIFQGQTRDIPSSNNCKLFRKNKWPILTYVSFSAQICRNLFTFQTSKYIRNDGWYELLLLAHGPIFAIDSAEW